MTYNTNTTYYTYSMLTMFTVLAILTMLTMFTILTIIIILSIFTILKYSYLTLNESSLAHDLVTISTRFVAAAMVRRIAILLFRRKRKHSKSRVPLRTLVAKI